jgi:hypothetical protein
LGAVPLALGISAVDVRYLLGIVTDQRQRYEYLVIEIRYLDDLQSRLDQHSKVGWRLVQTFQSDGFTVRLIFERPVEPTGAGNGS